MRAWWIVVVLSFGCASSGGDEDASPRGGDDTEGVTDTAVPGDRDEDGYADDIDCDDTRADVNPGVASDGCDGVDEDCDGLVDENPDFTWYTDADGDGFGASGAAGSVTCDPGVSSGLATNRADCDDGNAAIWPGANDACDGRDNDCDGAVDEDESLWPAWYADLDGDGLGDPDVVVYGCDAAESGGADNGWDCEDTDASNPIVVATDGRRGADGSYTDPIQSIQSAVSVTSDCVLVLSGSYSEDINTAGRSVRIYSAEGADATVVTGTGRAPVLTVEYGETVSVRGLTLSGGGGYAYTYSGSYWDGTQTIYYDNAYSFGGGAYVVSSAVTFDDVVFRSNVLPAYAYTWTSSTSYSSVDSYGGGLYANSALVELNDVDFVGNESSQGSAATCDYGTLVATRVRMNENVSDFSTVTGYGADMAFTNLLVNANSARYNASGISVTTGVLAVRNATLVDNDYGIAYSDTDLTIDSSIIFANQVGLYDTYASYAAVTLLYSNVSDNSLDFSGTDDLTGRDGNVSAAPGFVSFTADRDADGDDLSLSSRSAMRDAGNPDYTDPDGTRADMGAFGGPNGSWP